MSINFIIFYLFIIGSIHIIHRPSVAFYQFIDFLQQCSYTGSLSTFSFFLFFERKMDCATGRRLENAQREQQAATTKLSKFPVGSTPHAKHSQKLKAAEDRLALAEEHHLEFIRSILSVRLGEKVWYADYNGCCMDCVRGDVCDKENRFKHNPPTSDCIEILEPILIKFTSEYISQFEMDTGIVHAKALVSAPAVELASAVEMAPAVELAPAKALEMAPVKALEMAPAVEIASAVEIAPAPAKALVSDPANSVSSAHVEPVEQIVQPSHTQPSHTQPSHTQRIACACGLMREAHFPQCKTCWESRHMNPHPHLLKMQYHHLHLQQMQYQQHHQLHMMHQMYQHQLHQMYQHQFQQMQESHHQQI